MFKPSEQEDLTDLKPSLDQTVTLQFDFHFESLSIILYNSDISQVCSKVSGGDALLLLVFVLRIVACLPAEEKQQGSHPQASLPTPQAAGCHTGSENNS